MAFSKLLASYSRKIEQSSAYNDKSISRFSILYPETLGDERSLIHRISILSTNRAAAIGSPCRQPQATLKNSDIFPA